MTTIQQVRHNIALSGIELHLMHRPAPLPLDISIALSLLRFSTLILVLWPMIRLGERRMRRPKVVAAAAMTLLSWLLLFSPISWSHYLIYLCPLWDG